MSARIAGLGGFAVGWTILIAVCLFCRGGSRRDAVVLQALAGRRGALQMRIAAVEHRLRSGRGDFARAGSRPSPGKAVATARQALDQRTIDVRTALDSHLLELGLRAYWANIPQTYGRYFRNLKLNPEQTAGLESVLLTHHEAELQIMASAQISGVSGSDSTAALLEQEENNQFQSDLQSLLGPAYGRYRQLERAEPVAPLTAKVANIVALTAAPLSGPQADQLSQVLAEASSAYQAGGAASPATIDWAVAFKQARGILLPNQFSALQSVHAEVELARLESQFDREED